MLTKYVKYFQPVPHVVRVGNKEYFFRVKYGICMAEVDDRDVEKVLSLRRKICCGGNVRSEYKLASDAEVRIWSGISER